MSMDSYNTVFSSVVVYLGMELRFILTLSMGSHFHIPVEVRVAEILLLVQILLIATLTSLSSNTFEVSSSWLSNKPNMLTETLGGWSKYGCSASIGRRSLFTTGGTSYGDIAEWEMCLSWDHEKEST